MLPVEKAAVFLMIIGMEKGQKIIEVMDNGEIKAVISEIKNIKSISREIQESVMTEFKELGYEEQMKPSDILTIIRFLFNGSKISK
ncbi:hypothetical protein SRRS_31230 [Sporomusa rhizae]|uniref:magnesium and cobalt transport protein CorA n=1 Tax=Sporomusa rhizae TaxID=357999 RepID=UPI00352A35B9